MTPSLSLLGALFIAGFLSACASANSNGHNDRASNLTKPITTPGVTQAAFVPPQQVGRVTIGAIGPAGWPAARIVAARPPLQCVPYARRNSDVAIWGNAWTWWHQAKNRYARDNRPEIGSVMVMKRTNRLRYGHVAVVTRILNDREIVVDHANWLNQGQIHRDVPVRDVSARNDWSAVRVWYTPGNMLGANTYPTHGFIHPLYVRPLRLLHPPMRGPDVRGLQEALNRRGFALAVDGTFGPRTRDTLAAYQAQAGLPGSGIAQKDTFVSLGL